MNAYLDYSGLQILSHRGGSIESYENTIKSFQYSIDAGCKYIETDVQLSSDGIPYIFHDDDLKRLLKDDRKFYSLHSSEIDELRLFDKYEIPRLEKVLLSFPETYFQIDVKTNEVASPAIEIIKKTNSQNRVCVASFNSARLKKIRENNPDICLSMGPLEVMKMLLASFNLYNKDIPGECLQVPIYYYGIKVVTKRFVDFVHSKGLKIIVWTINDADTFKKLQRYNVDGVITDEPKKLLNLLK